MKAIQDGFKLPACRDDAVVEIGLFYGPRATDSYRSKPRDPLRAYRRAISGSGKKGDAVAWRVIGGEAIGVKIVPLLTGDPDLPGRLSHLSGIVLPGGGDLHPMQYGEAPGAKLKRLEPGRDEYEEAIIGYAKANGIPLFGICRGAQSIAVFYGEAKSLFAPQELGALFLGGCLPSQQQGGRTDGRARPVPPEALKTRGSLHQDLSELHVAAGSHMRVYHGVSVTAASRIFGDLFTMSAGTAGVVKASSRHHQAIKSLSAGLKITARSTAHGDGLIEMIEGEGDHFVLGTQFHPETNIVRNQDAELFQRIFDRFLIEALARRRRVLAGKMNAKK